MKPSKSKPILTNQFKSKVYLLLFVFPMLLQAQLKIGDNAKNVNPHALFELESSNKGVLISRMSDTERDAAFVSNIPNGLLIYNTTENCFQYYQALLESWICMGGTASGQLTLEGNILSLGVSSVELPFGPLQVQSGETDTSLISIGTSDPITLKAGNNITLTETGNTITLSARSSGGGGGATGPQGPAGPPGPPGPQGPAGASGTASGTGTGTDSQTLTISGTLLEISQGNSVDLAPFTNTDDQQITTFTINASNTIILELEDGGTRQLTLPSALASGTLNTDNQTLTLVGNDLTIAGGNTVSFPATTDSQTLSLSGNTLSLTSGGAVNLSSFTNTDSQTISGVTSGTDLLLKLTGVATQTVDLSPFVVDTNTDTQTISGITSGTNLLLKLTGVATQTVDLSSLVATPTALSDADNDTTISVDDGTDPDTISFTVSGTEHFRMDGYRLEVLNSDNNLAIGTGALAGITTGTYNLAIGENVLNNTTTGSNNTAVGQGALITNTSGWQNTAVGQSSLRQNQASDNTAVGNLALSNNTTGTFNTALGSSALEGNKIGTENTAIGFYSLIAANNSGSRNTAVGARTLVENTTGRDNVAVGTNALLQNTEGTHNTAVGVNSLSQNVTGTLNTAVGFNALNTNISGVLNTAIGSDALNRNTTGNLNTAVGYAALRNNLANENTAVGTFALSNNTSGTLNTAIGTNALNRNTTGNSNTAVGGSSLSQNISGTSNTAVGFNTLSANISGNYNSVLGYRALQFNQTGGDNVAVGDFTLSQNIMGFSNTAIGSWALMSNENSNNTGIGNLSLRNNREGVGNSALGSESGRNLNTNSNDNTFIGYLADTVSGTLLNNSTALGANALVTTSNTIQLGDTNVFLVNTSATVSATAFRGDGSQLTNVPIGLDSYSNLAIGTQMNSLSPTTYYEGRENLAIFRGALESNITGYDNIAIGQYSLKDNTSGNNNIAMGEQAMTLNTTGHANIALGYQALYNSNGSFNLGMGSYALSSITTGSRNIALGNAALSDATGSDNTSVGAWALDDLVNGSDNTALGSEAGGNLNTNSSNSNTFIGSGADTVSGTTIQNSTAIGANAIVNIDNTIQLGDSNVTQVNTFGDFSKSGTNYMHPDYVFEKVFNGYSDYNNSYELLTLEAVESFIKKNSHLPGVQSRADIRAKNSWNVSENVRTNLEKVEELFLYTIAQEK